MSYETLSSFSSPKACRDNTNNTITSDAKTMLKAIHENVLSSRVIMHSSKSLKNNYEVVLAAVKKDAHMLEYVSESLKNEKVIVLEAVKQDGYALEHASEELRNNKDIVLEAVRQKPRSLRYASEQLKDDKDIMMAAVKRVGHVLTQASLTLRNDKELVLVAVNQYGYALKFASSALKNDREVVIQAVRQYGNALADASNHLKNDKGVVMIAINQNPKAYQYASDVVKNDLEVMVMTAYVLKQSSFGTVVDNDVLNKETLIQRIQECASEQEYRAIFLASKMGLIWEYGMEELVVEFPDEVRTYDESTCLCSFMLVAASPYSDLDTIFNLMLICPDLIPGI